MHRDLEFGLRGTRQSPQPAGDVLKRPLERVETEAVLTEKGCVGTALEPLVDPPFHIAGLGPNPIRGGSILCEIVGYYQAAVARKDVCNRLVAHAQSRLDL